MVARLSFVVIFENVVAALTSFMRWMIPDIPTQLRQQMKQHAYLTNQLIMQQEFKRAKELGNLALITQRRESKQGSALSKRRVRTSPSAGSRSNHLRV